jgi:signal transduction histidine kinase
MPVLSPERQRPAACSRAIGLETSVSDPVPTAVATLAHDLKNSLTIIRARAQLMQRRIEETSELDRQHVQEAFQQIEGATARMAVLLDELVDTSAPAGLSLHAASQRTDLARAARTLAADFQQTTDRHCVRVLVPAGEVLGRWHPVHIERILSNLLSNAIKFSPEGGEIVVSVWVEFDRREQTAWACLRVTDEGIGIPAHDLAHVFDLRHRGSNARGRVEGTGLGLVAVKQLVAEYHGAVSAESEEGRGSRFTVQFPVEPSAIGGGNLLSMATGKSAHRQFGEVLPVKLDRE